MEDIYILQIETATPVCAVALSKNGKTIATIDSEEPNLHASHLTVFIDKLLADVQKSLADLAAVAVSMGPGSYTGLRIGVSTAKGLCYGLGIPLIGINTLDAMFNGLASEIKQPLQAIAMPMIDARRMEVYTAMYDQHGDKIADTTAQIIDAESFPDTTTEYMLFGSGADKFIPLFENQSNVHIQPEFKNSASFLSKLAFERYESQAFEDLVYFEPFYLKDFIATVAKKR